jgi:hypothetical protein
MTGCKIQYQDLYNTTDFKDVDFPYRSAQSKLNQASQSHKTHINCSRVQESQIIVFYRIFTLEITSPILGTRSRVSPRES